MGVRSVSDADICTLVRMADGQLVGTCVMMLHLNYGLTYIRVLQRPVRLDVGAGGRAGLHVEFGGDADVCVRSGSA